MKIISMSDLRKNIYAATKELPVEVQAKGKTLFYITESIFDDGKPAQPIQPILNQEQQIRLIVKMVLAELKTTPLKVVGDLSSIPDSTTPPKNKPSEMGTMVPKIENLADRPVASAIGNAPEHLWDDYNLMPVFKQGEDDQFCNVWHQKGLRQRVYLIKKFRPDGTIELEGKYCRSCIDGFLKGDGHLE